MLKTAVQFRARPPFLCIPLCFLLFITMDKFQIKELIREVIKEIYQKPRGIETFGDAISSLENEMDKSVPALGNPEMGRTHARVMLNQIYLACQAIIKSSLKPNKDIHEKSVYSFNHNSQGLIMLLIVWANKINKINPKLNDTIDEFMNECRRHLYQIGQQTNRIINNVSGKDLERPNYINAIKEMEHLKEIVINTAGSIDEVFNLTKGLNFEV